MSQINWGHLPVDSLNGVTSSELELLTELSGSDHQRDDLLKQFIECLEDGAATEDPELPELEASDVSSEMDLVELESLPRSTYDQMILHGKKFEEFMRQHRAEDLKTMEEKKLAEYLRFYFFGLKKVDGGLYSPASLVCIRAGIHRYLNLVLKRKVDLIGGEQFAAANRMLSVKVRHFHNNGGSSNQFCPIEEGDLAKIRTYFDRSSAERLQDEVIFTLLYVLGERGQEHLKYLRRRGTLTDCQDSHGTHYLALVQLPTKNQSSDPTKSKGNQPKQSRIYGAQRDVILQYDSLLPPGDEFFPRPLVNGSSGEFRFSPHQVRGINWLASFMRHLSTVCKLSKQYTNHCIRVTRISDMFDNGCSMDEIMAVTGQRSEATVRRYLSRKRDGTLRRVASTVSDSLQRNVSEPTGPVLPAAGAGVVMENRSIDVKSVQQPMFANCHFDSCTFNF